MSSFHQFEYAGNAIFRDQPNHSYFDKPFEDDQDCLFQYLNEIDPHFLKPEQQAECLNPTSGTIVDPRTKNPITDLCYDYTREEDTKIFQSPRRSTMTEKQHELGIRVLNLLQQCLEVEEEDLYNWYRLQKTRLSENQLFQKFVCEFTHKCKEQMYAPCRKLLELYQNWYKNKAIKLLKRYPNEAYNTHLGLPQVRQCKNVLNDWQVKITNPEIVSIVGEQCSWQDNIKDELRKFNYTIASYTEVYANSEDLRDSLEDNLQLQFIKTVERELSGNPYFYIPLESLLFLLTAGDYIDLPTEMFLNIKESENMESDFKNYVIMELPLPSRQCGWHTYQQIVQQAVTAMLSIKQTKYVDEENSQTSLNNSTDYKVSTLQNFMEKSTLTADKLCKFSKTLTKWQLATLENDQNFQMYTSMDSLIENQYMALKLEYKPRFGCELLTKYEILKEWFKLKLTGASRSTCLRLNVTNYQTLLEEQLSIQKLEECLFSIYHINCNQVLNNLFEFLKMLYNMPSGQYMLRYNPKFKDKLMLCKPSQEITQNTIHLDKLLSSNITDIEFMLEPNFLPIDANLSNLMHLQHKILPAAFCPRAVTKKGFKIDNLFESKQRNRLVQKRKVNGKPILNKTQMKRIRKRKRKNDAIRAKSNELKELEREMELDRKMLNF